MPPTEKEEKKGLVCRKEIGNPRPNVGKNGQLIKSGEAVSKNYFAGTPTCQQQSSLGEVFFLCQGDL